MSPVSMTENASSEVKQPSDERSVPQAMLRGAQLRCPSCGKGAMFKSYLKVADECPNCGEELHHHRADDAPPYFTMFIVGHIVVGGVLSLEQAYAPPSWVHVVIWLPLLIIMSLALLPPIKGAFVGLQWAIKLHGFGRETDQSTEPDGSIPAPSSPKSP